jgi:hypothetical protein
VIAGLHQVYDLGMEFVAQFTHLTPLDKWFDLAFSRLRAGFAEAKPMGRPA